MSRPDNAALRALFALPPVATSTSTALIAFETPTPKEVTGDRELDAVLWLRDCIKTGDAALIAQALAAFKKIKTPAKELEDRYIEYVRRASNGHFGEILKSFGFADLAGLASKSASELAQRQDAVARFGSIDAIFDDLPVEEACKKALHGLKQKKTRGGWHDYDHDKADARFAKCSDLVPHTLTDCLHVLKFGTDLYWQRHACAHNAGDHWPEFQEHRDYCFRSLALLLPQSKEEAFAVLEYLETEDADHRDETPAILRNLVSGGWQ